MTTRSHDGLSIKNLTTSSSKSRLAILDILRLVAIFFIVTGHLGLGGRIGFIELGTVGVSLFIFISGMSLEYVYGKGEGLKFLPFFIKRILRIYPIHVMCLIVAAIILGSDYLPSDPVEFFLTLTGFCAFAGRWGCRLVETSWFLGLIISLYLIFPLLSKGLKKHPIGVILALFFISVISHEVVRYFYMSMPGRLIEWFPPCRVFEFGLGIFIARRDSIMKIIEKIKLPALSHILQYGGNLSFPIFLIHFPLIAIISFWRNVGGTLLGLSVYFVLTWLISHGLLVVDEWIQRKIQPIVLSRESM